jgi:DNA repair exonuclease SbcCD nuclease subunit
MKICLLGDTHLGARNDSKHFHEYFEKFYDLFFSYLDEHAITTVIQLGDLFDRRKYVNFYTLAESKRYFFDRLAERKINFYALVGNHDIFWKHSLSVNSPGLLLQEYDNISIHDKPTTLRFPGLSIDLVPWMCNENEDEIAAFVESSVSPVCVGHFELVGFPLMKGVESHDGIEAKFLDRYDHVYSGHYHTRSTNGNVTYTGTPYELVWSDYKDTKGFYVLDTSTHQVEFVENTLRMFYKVFYDDSKFDLHDVLGTDYNRFKDKYVKIVVMNKQNPYVFDKMLDEIFKVSPIDVMIVEDFTELNTSGEDTDVNQAEDTLTSLYNFIDQQTLQVESPRLKAIMHELYMEALSSENIE